DVKIKRSIYSFVDTATITLPASARLKTETQDVPQSVSTARSFQEGDKVEIWLGYDSDDNLHREFSGFVKSVNAATPCVIDCEGYSWQLRRKNVPWSTEDDETKLKDLLAKLVEGTDITLSKSIPDVPVHQICEGNISGTEALDWIKKNMYLTVYLSENELYAGWDYIAQPDKVNAKYRIGWNLVKDDQLKFRWAEDVKVQVRAISFNNRNEAVVGMAGDSGGVTKNIRVDGFHSEAELKKVAKTEADKLRYDGFEGKVTGFLQPFALPGYKAILQDPHYKDREGTYLIESTEVKFGMSGGRRICELGKKITKENEQATGTVN
ncbi:MAG TPA: hypothetical protein VGD35_21610, partial [Chitinophaga sp.]